MNSVMCGTGRDFSNNYFGFAWHTVRDEGLIGFTGMNYPYGDHCVLSDTQPLLSAILKYLPFFHSQVIGILHLLMFGSFVITPLILFRFLQRMNISNYPAFCISLALVLLSPQMMRIHVGHFSLSYAFYVPLGLLLLQSYFRYTDLRHATYLSVYVFLLFAFHPYVGSGMAMFFLFSIFIFFILDRRLGSFGKALVHALTAGALPLLLFRIFMLLTDNHAGRPVMPSGHDKMITSPGSIFIPQEGAFKDIMTRIFPFDVPHWEGYCYLGIFMILCLFVCIPLLVFMRKGKMNPLLVSLLISSLFMLALAFGVHNQCLSLFGIQSEFFSQLRATGRFSWYFYYVFPLFFFGNVLPFLAGKFEKRNSAVASGIVSLYLIFNFAEASSHFAYYNSHFWNHRNLFNAELLNKEEKLQLKSIEKIKPQAILPLPFLHQGSEMYDRLGSTNSMALSFMFAFHSGIPVLGAVLPRPSIIEAENTIGLLNAYKGPGPVHKLLTKAPFFVIRTSDELMCDEERIDRVMKYESKNDSCRFGMISRERFLAPKIDSTIIRLTTNRNFYGDSLNYLMIFRENRKPFISSSMENYEKIYVLDSNKVSTGEYIVSLHYHYAERVFPAIACNLVVTENSPSGYKWGYNFPIRLMSGFYNGFGVVEYKINLNEKKTYEFIMAGAGTRTYRISDFMLRPSRTTIIYEAGNSAMINNFPVQNLD